MESRVPGRPNRETGLPPGVEVGPLGKRFVAFLINLSVPVVVGIVLLLLPPTMSGGLRATLVVICSAIVIGWVIFVCYLLAMRAASPGLRAMKLQVVGFLDGRPIGIARAVIRALVFWALFVTGIGLLIMLIMELRHPRKQGWHDLAATAVMIKERVLAPPVQPGRPAASMQQGPPAQLGNGSQQLQPNGARAPMSPGYGSGEGYGSHQPVRHRAGRTLRTAAMPMRLRIRVRHLDHSSSTGRVPRCTLPGSTASTNSTLMPRRSRPIALPRAGRSVMRGCNHRRLISRITPQSLRPHLKTFGTGRSCSTTAGESRWTDWSCWVATRRPTRARKMPK